MSDKPSISWSEFVARKKGSSKKLQNSLMDRLESGHPSHIALDLDLYPLINSWNSIPFTFTIYGCCSGTPHEHEREGYGPVNGLKGNPHACFYAHSFEDHPLFKSFNGWVNSALAEFDGITNRSSSHGGEGYNGIYLTCLNINVLQKNINDLKYLTNFWSKLKSTVDQFRFTFNSDSTYNDFKRFLPKSERVLLNLIENEGEAINVELFNEEFCLGKLSAVSPPDYIVLQTKGSRDPQYLSFFGEKPIKTITTWDDKVLYDSKEMEILNGKWKI